jgi:hypothetical protein
MGAGSVSAEFAEGVASAGMVAKGIFAGTVGAPAYASMGVGDMNAPTVTISYVTSATAQAVGSALQQHCEVICEPSTLAMPGP